MHNLRERSSPGRQSKLKVQVVADGGLPSSASSFPGTLSKSESLNRKRVNPIVQENFRNRMFLILCFMLAIFGISSIISMFQTKRQGRLFKHIHDVSSSKNIRRRSNFGAIRLIGERNSGTSWVFQFLQDCFNHTLMVRDTVTRYKHFFQPPLDPLNVTRVYEDTLVIAIFRDPYFWVKGMMKKPHHAPYHQDLEWHEFLTKPWTMPRSKRDIEYASAARLSGPVCQYKHYYDDIVSCLKGARDEYNFTQLSFSPHQPQYEMKPDGSGEPYQSILELRRDKILNFVIDVPNIYFVKGYVMVRYEDLVEAGNQFLLDQIEAYTGVKPQCTVVPPQDRKQRILEYDFVKYMNEHIDWLTESLIGYQKIEINETNYEQ